MIDVEEPLFWSSSLKSFYDFRLLGQIDLSTTFLLEINVKWLILNLFCLLIVSSDDPLFSISFSSLYVELLPSIFIPSTLSILLQTFV